MARRKKRPRSNQSKSTPLITYTVSMAHEPTSECDSCAQPRPVLIEQEGGAWICEVCAGMVSHGQFWRMAVINGLYSWDGGDGL